MYSYHSQGVNDAPKRNLEGDKIELYAFNVQIVKLIYLFRTKGKPLINQHANRSERRYCSTIKSLWKNYQ